eukprot:TRINITY_DN8332_c0_g1_i9.p1 TRINITY_DN8332_c0_g1~~TRINITY_DN8332_c0_g1_i9.p1  ORF type:complete len:113 (+),score=23.30 TRINITY_DN8332_c0_g1_i9:25-339(+)
MIRRPPRSTPLYSSAASDVYKRQLLSRLSRLLPLIAEAFDEVAYSAANYISCFDKSILGLLGNRPDRLVFRNLVSLLRNVLKRYLPLAVNVSSRLLHFRLLLLF